MRGAWRFGEGRFLHRLSDGWSAGLHLRHAGREQGDDLVMMFTGPAGKRKIRLALFANLSPCGGVSDSYLVCCSPDPFRAGGGIVFARQSRSGAI
jgi:hypothetical protein